MTNYPKSPNHKAGRFNSYHALEKQDGEVQYGQPVVEPDFGPATRLQHEVMQRSDLPRPELLPCQEEMLVRYIQLELNDIIFSRHVCHCEGDELCIVCQAESISDEDDLCEFDCTRFAGWLPADDYFVACSCNVDVRGLSV